MGKVASLCLGQRERVPPRECCLGKVPHHSMTPKIGCASLAYYVAAAHKLACGAENGYTTAVADPERNVGSLEQAAAGPRHVGSAAPFWPFHTLE